MIKKIISIALFIFIISSVSVWAQDSTSRSGWDIDSDTGQINPGLGDTGQINSGDSPEQDSNNSSNQNIEKLQNPLRANSVKEVILLVVDIAIYLGVAISVLAIIYVGFQFVLAQGNPDKISDAKRWFFYIIIGLAILISSKVIVEIVTNTLSDAGVVNSEFLK